MTRSSNTPSQRRAPGPSQSVLGQALSSFQIWRAGFVLFWESFWPALLLCLAPILLFTIASLFGVWRATPSIIHWGLLIGSAIATLWIARRFLWSLTWPTRKQALVRLEEDGDLQHAPLQALDDVPFGTNPGDPFWQAHLLQMRDRVKDTILKKPKSTISDLDPYSLRYGAAGLFLLAWVTAGDDQRRLIADGFAPAALSSSRVSVADIWIEAPDYTGRPPIYLLRSGEPVQGVRDQVNAAQGSTIVAQVNGSQRFSLLFETETERLEGASQNEQTGQNSNAARSVISIPQSGVLKLRIAGTEGAWPIGVIDDQVPTVTFAEIPSKTDDGLLAISVEVNDDYGIATARLEMNLDPNQDRPLDAPDLDQAALAETRNLPLTGLTNFIGKGQFDLDLQSDPWAGLDVVATLVVEDGAGQMGKTDIVNFQLPARTFYNPLAQAVIEQRQTLAVAAKNWPRVGRSLDALTLAPDAFFDRSKNYLLIRTAFWRVMQQNGEGFEETVEDFWPLALQLEDEALELARRRLDAAEEALRQALERGADDDEIFRLVEELREAMNQYLQALAQSGQQQAQRGNQPTEQLDQSDLDQMLNSIRDLAQSGAQNAARQALSDLQNLLDNLRLSGSGQQGSGQQGGGQSQPGQGQQGQSGPGGAGQSGSGANGNAGQAGDLIGRQRDLANRSFTESQNPGGGSGQGLAQDQRGLGDDLDELRQALDGAAGNGDIDANGQAARSFDEAAREMERAERALNADNFDTANTAMERAIGALRNGAESLAAEAAQAAREARGLGEGEGNEGGFGYDPLGRPIGAAPGPNETDVPDGTDYQRARDILLELRRRLSEGERTEEEIEYLERLLERF